MENYKLLIEEYVIAVMLLVMTIINGANILARYVFQYSLAFSEELLVYMFVWASMLGASAAVAKGANLGLSIFTDLLPERWQKHAAAFSLTCGITLFVILFAMGAQMVGDEMKNALTTPTMGMPEWIFGMGIPVSAAFFIYRCIQLLVRTYRGVS